MSSVFGAFGASRRGGKEAVPDTADRRPRIDGVVVDRIPEVIAEVRRGSRRTIAIIGADVLARPCRVVTDFGGPGLRALVDDLYATMACCDGVGLAANQIGVDLRLFVYDCADAYGVRHVGHVVNPVLEVVTQRGRKETDEEGCLSVPGPVAQVSRAAAAVVRGVDMFGKPVRVEGTGTLARCLQHECDHLDGVLYVDRLSGRDRKKVLKAMSEQQEPTFKRWDVRAAELGKPLAADLDPNPPVVAMTPAVVAPDEGGAGEALAYDPAGAPEAGEERPVDVVPAESSYDDERPAEPAPDALGEVTAVPPESTYDDERPAGLPDEDEVPRA